MDIVLTEFGSLGRFTHKIVLSPVASIKWVMDPADKGLRAMSVNV